MERIRVDLIWGEEPPQLVGELLRHGRHIHFKYAPSYLARGHSLSPIKLPFGPAVQTGDPRLFEGLHGVFNDSLPDGWGRLLLDRALAARGKNPFDLDPLDRLAHVGTLGPGALAYHPVRHASIPIEETSLDDFAQASIQILEGNSTHLVEELYRLGGSSGGARPKIQAGYCESTDHWLYGQEALPEGYGHWLLKFPSAYDLPDIAHIEYAYYLMATAAGIQMMPSRLFRGHSGKCYFGTQRFDRQGNRRLHLHAASGLLHDDFRHSQMDYGHLMDAAFLLEKDVRAYQKVLRLAAFNIFAHNQDDHSKNFAFLMDWEGTWQFAPAYDLTFSRTAHGCHSTMLAGEYQTPSVRHLLRLAEVFGVHQAPQIIDEVQAAIREWLHFAHEAGVSPASTQLIRQALEGIRARR
jgi:serine/threonine-protein kinase HipA